MACNEHGGKWRVIPENPSHFCFEDGRIWSFNKSIWMATYKHHLGYVFGGNFTVNGKRKLCLLHQVVASAFIPNTDNLPELNHLDGDKKNNHYTNLEWTTRQGNMQHGWANGLMENTRAAFSKVTPEQVVDIRGLFDRKEATPKELGSMYGLKPRSIYNILNRVTHKENQQS